MDPPRAQTNRADRIAQLTIYDTRRLNPNATARDAAEQLLGRRMTEHEWGQQSALWLFNWKLVPSPLSFAEKVRRAFGLGFSQR